MACVAITIAVLPGDGIGPEVVEQAKRVLAEVAPDLSFEEALVGGAGYEARGTPLPEETRALCERADAVLLGAVGGPKWDSLEPKELRPEIGGLLALRKGLDLYANLRPAKVLAPLMDRVPVRMGPSGIMDLLVVRELTGGIYFGEPRGRRAGGEVAVDTCVYSKREIRRVSVRAFELARERRKKVTCVDKANVLETSRLWREVVAEVSEEFKEVDVGFMLVDNCAMQLIRDPGQFDVILTENMFGDILSDEAAQLTGSLGLLPSASLGSLNRTHIVNGKPRSLPFGVYEPVHGSAPDITGLGIANPIAAILSAAMLLRISLGRATEADAVEKAVEQTLAEHIRTPDLGGSATTQEVGEAILRHLHSFL